MKKQLLNLTLILFAIGVVGLVYPFVKSMGPNDRAKNDATLKINIKNISRQVRWNHLEINWKFGRGSCVS